MSQQVLLVGCGDLGIPLGQQLLNKGVDITALRRDISQLPADFHSLSIDVTDPVSCQSLREKEFDSVVITLTPGEFSDAAYLRCYVQSLKNLLPIFQQQKKPPHIYFVSSTSVYHQSQGEWVDEESATLPFRFSGQRLLEAEKLLANSGLPYSIIRFAGIYGPGRKRLIEQVLAGKGAGQESMQWTNRIHRDDCVGFLHHLIHRQFNGDALLPVYIGCDNEPALMLEVKQWLAEQLDVSLGPQAGISQRVDNKRCRNQRLTASGYRLRYPNFKAGYQAVLAQLNK
jgi:nucleoside-diphosphate-sugar epimerase